MIDDNDEPPPYENEERETVLFTVSAEVAQAAIAQVASCEACNPRADWPFEAVLRSGHSIQWSPHGLHHA